MSTAKSKYRLSDKDLEVGDGGGGGSGRQGVKCKSPIHLILTARLLQ
jgi:hypothetical protein